MGPSRATHGHEMHAAEMHAVHTQRGVSISPWDEVIANEVARLHEASLTGTYSADM